MLDLAGSAATAPTRTARPSTPSCSPSPATPGAGRRARRAQPRRHRRVRQGHVHARRPVDLRCTRRPGQRRRRPAHRAGHGRRQHPLPVARGDVERHLPRPRDGHARPQRRSTSCYADRGRLGMVYPVATDGPLAGMCKALGRADLAADPRFADLQGRVRYGDEVNDEIQAETTRFTTAELVELMDRGRRARGAGEHPPVDDRGSPRAPPGQLVVETVHPDGGPHPPGPPARPLLQDAAGPAPPRPQLRRAHRRGARRRARAVVAARSPPCADKCHRPLEPRSS